MWLATGFFSLQALSSGHGAVYLSIAGAGYLAFRFATGTPLALTRRLRDFGIVGALLLVPALLIVPPYLQVQREMGLKRTLENWETAPESFLASPTLVHSRLLAAFSAQRVNARASAFLFPGYLPLILAAAALVLAIRGSQYRRHTWFFLLLTILSALLSAGPPLSLWPYVYWLPGLNFIRIPSRFMLLGILGVAVLAAIGFERIASRIRGDTRLAVSIVVPMLLARRVLDAADGAAVSAGSSRRRSLARFAAQAVCRRRSAGAAVSPLSQHLHAAFAGALAADRPRP